MVVARAHHGNGANGSLEGKYSARLRRRWSAGGRVVEEKLLVNRCDKRPYVPDREKWTKQRWDKRFGSGSNVGRLTELAGSFTLSFYVRVA
jgi:hypothetical protein